MIELPNNFANDLKSPDTSLIPLVVIESGGEQFLFSTNNIRFKNLSGDERQYLPIVKNIPTIKESFDFENRNYRVSNVTLQLYNTEYNGERFSDTIGNNSLINSTVHIYFKSPSSTALSECLRVYIGYIQNYKHDEDTAEITLEDKSQLLLDQKLPIQKTADVNSLAERYRNKPAPIVYGHVDRSRCVQDFQDEIIQGSQKLFISDLAWHQGIDKVYALAGGVYGLIMPWNRYYPHTTGNAAEATPQYSVATAGNGNIGNYILFKTYEGNVDPRRNAIANNHCEVAVERKPISVEGSYRVIFGGNHPHGWYNWNDPPAGSEDTFIQAYWYESEKLKLFDEFSDDDLYPKEEVEFPAWIRKHSETPIQDTSNLVIGSRNYNPADYTPAQIIPLPADLANLEDSSVFGDNGGAGNIIASHSRVEIDWEFDNAIPSDMCLNVVQLENGSVYQPEMPCFIHLEYYMYGKHLKYYPGSLYFAIGSANLAHTGDLRYITSFEFKNDNEVYSSETEGGNFNPEDSIFNTDGTASGYVGIIPHINTGSATDSFWECTFITDHKEEATDLNLYGDATNPLYFFGDGSYIENGVYRGVEGYSPYTSLDSYSVNGAGYESGAFISATDGGHLAHGGGDVHTDPMSNNDVLDYRYAWIGNVHDMNDNIRFQFDAATANDPSIDHIEISDVYDQIPSFPNYSGNIGTNNAIYGVRMKINAFSMWTYAILNRFDDKEIFADVRGRVDYSDYRYTGGNTVLTTTAQQAHKFLHPSGEIRPEIYDYGDPGDKPLASVSAKVHLSKKGSTIGQANVPNPPGGGSGGA